MKKKYLCIIMLLIAISCNNDQEYDQERNRIEETLFSGEWASFIPSNIYLTNLVLASSKKCSMNIIINKVGKNTIYIEDVGRWQWNSQDHKLNLSLINNNMPALEILDLNNNIMRIRNTKFNCIDYYYHVVETKEINAGDTGISEYILSLNEPDINVSSLNDSVAFAFDNGTIVGEQGGITYICVQSSERTALIKVKVKSRIDVVSDEIHLSISDIIKKHGTPDLEGKVSDKYFGIQYKNPSFMPGLSFLQYDYDKETDEIYRILTVYEYEDNYFRDLEYIINNYFKLDTDGIDTYGEFKEFWDNSFFLQPIIHNQIGFIYRNLDYNTYTVDW